MKKDKLEVALDGTVTMPKKKHKVGKIISKIFCVILALIVAVAPIGAVVTVVGNNSNTKKAESFASVVNDEAIVPTKDDDGNWCFTTDRDLKVLQLTDVHIGGGWMSLKKDGMALNAVASMISEEKPDLVIVTGDVSYPVPFQAGTFNNMSSAKIFASLMEQLGVYWTIAFGNHDTESYSYYSREDISDFYSNEDFKYCLYTAGPEDVDGEGNQIINVKNSLGLTTQTLYLFDSHSYTDGDYFGIKWAYDNIHQNQIDWYKENVEKTNANNQEILNTIDINTLPNDISTYQNVKSLAFFHIPMTEYGDAWNGYVDNNYQDTDDIKYIYGVAGETGKVVYSGVHEDNLFETMESLGSTKGVFCGHDHLNNFSLEYKGIRLTYGMSIDYLAYAGIYKLGAQRGCTEITVRPDGSFDCTQQNYYQDKFTSEYTKEDVTMQDTTKN